jgi:hypothetical protein
VSDTNNESSCTEGAEIPSGGLCTAQCNEGFTASAKSLSCSAGMLSPSTFLCQPDACRIPVNISNAYIVDADAVADVNIISFEESLNYSDNASIGINASHSTRRLGSAEMHCI